MCVCVRVYTGHGLWPMDQTTQRANERASASAREKIATSKLKTKRNPALTVQPKKDATPSVINIVSSVRDKLLSNQAESTVLCCHSILLIVIVFSNMNVCATYNVRVCNAHTHTPLGVKECVYLRVYIYRYEYMDVTKCWH